MITTMVNTAQPAGFFRPTYGKAAVALLFVLLCGMTLTAGFADEHGGHGHGRQGHGHFHGNRYRGEYQRGYGYAQPVYVPEPVYYDVPPPSPGISLFFPLDFRR